MRRVLYWKFAIIFPVFILLTAKLTADTLPPKNLRLQKVTFSKISIAWEPATSAQAPQKYLIMRNGKRYRTITSTSFTDSRLIPGRTYKYSIIAIDNKGKQSKQTAELKVKTLKPLKIDSGQLIQKTVDNFHSKNFKTADFEKSIDDKVATLKNSKLFDAGVIKDMVSEEIKWLRSPDKKLTPEERIKVKEDLDNFLEKHYAGQPFFVVYLQAKLIELADKHLLKKKYKGAIALYKAALSVSSKVELVTSVILNSLARAETAQINDNMPIKEIVQHLKNAEKYYLSFSNYFPDSNSYYKDMLYISAAIAWKKSFPQLLDYRNYSRFAYNSALKLAETSLAINPEDPMKKMRVEKIKKWNMVQLRISCFGNARRAVRGKMIIKNVDKSLSAWLPPDHSLLKGREYNLKGYPFNIPVYSGQKYDVTFKIKLLQAPFLKQEFCGITFEEGSEKAYFSNKKPLFRDNIIRGNRARVTFVIPRPLVPYNLRLKDDSLCWDWIPPNPYFKLKFFKVYCDNKEIGQTKDCNLKGISKSFECVYKVQAFGAGGKTTKFSIPFKVVAPVNDTPKTYENETDIDRKVATIKENLKTE
jgi:tetratricopeptide (TPR) repeat protein